MKRKTALITGVTGQDGSYLAKFLLKKNYVVYGIKRRSSLINTLRIDDIYKDIHEKNNKFILFHGDMTDSLSIFKIIQKTKPDEIYNLAAQSHVKVSFELPEYTAQVDALGTLRLLEGIRILNLIKKVKFYQASTSEMFGSANPPQSEKTEMLPVSPYGAAKLYAHWITKNYRDAYNIFASTGILFNHEGTKRGEEFVTRKITKGVARIYDCIKNAKPFNPIELGNLDSKRDWSDSEDFVDGVWKMLNQTTPKDYVLSSNETHSIREFVELAFSEAGIEGVWHGSGLNEEYSVSTKYAISKEPLSSILVRVNEKFYRPAEVDLLLGDSSPAREELGWQPKTSFNQLVKKMVEHDLNLP